MFAHPAEPFPSRPPYRPFLSGAPKFAPGLAPVPLSLWLRPDPERAANAANRARVLALHPDAARWDEASLPAQAEALALIEAALGETAPAGTAPLLRVGALTSDDLVIMEKRDEEWRTTALLLTAPTFFSAEEAFGRNILALHGPVPGNAPSDFSIGLSARIGALFDRLPPDTVMQRFNWTIQCGAERFAPDGAVHRARSAELGPERAAAALHLRVERQTIRRLPRTGAVLFTIRIALDPLAALDAEMLSALESAWHGAGGDARAYKKWDALDAAADIAFARR